MMMMMMNDDDDSSIVITLMLVDEQNEHYNEGSVIMKMTIRNVTVEPLTLSQHNNTIL